MRQFASNLIGAAIGLVVGALAFHQIDKRYLQD
jgi:hypothetical protein